MTPKRILFLGGAYAQIPIIQEAKNRGMFIITCDYLPENPGHHFADEYYNVSTTDLEGVLNLAKKIRPDFVIAYASDPAAPTAAFVSEEMGLPGNSFQSTQILVEKDKFRNLLKTNGFNTPNFTVLSEKDYLKENFSAKAYPLIIKPIDSSGSKGVSRIDNLGQAAGAIQNALIYSRSKRVIVEEYIDNDLADLHGDGFVIDGELKFASLGDHLYISKTHRFNPTGTLWPTSLDNERVKQVIDDVHKIIKLSGYKNGPVNIEARINSKGENYIMEIGPRNGGHFVPQAIKLSTGFDMVTAILDISLGKKVIFPECLVNPVAYYAVHSDVSGILQSITISNEIRPYIKEFHQYIQIGEQVNSFLGANSAIGIILFLFNSRKEMDYYLKNIEKFLNVRVLT